MGVISKQNVVKIFLHNSYSKLLYNLLYILDQNYSCNLTWKDIIIVQGKFNLNIWMLYIKIVKNPKFLGNLPNLLTL